MMQVLVEVSLYPLSRDYDILILDFVRRLRAYPNVEVTPGSTSTVIQGDYDDVFHILQIECKEALCGEIKTAFVIKLLNTA